MATAQRSAGSIQKNVPHLASIPRKISKDAIALLKTDHAAVKRCFKDYQKLVKTDASASKKISGKQDLQRSIKSCAN